MTTVAHYLTSLDYTYPIYDNTIDTNPNVPKDFLLLQTLKLDNFPLKTPPIKKNTPINNILSRSTTIKLNPLQDILQQSRQKINQFNESLLKEKTAVLPPPINTTSIRISKRQERSTPNSSKIIHYSPSGKGKASTPISKRKSSINLKQRLLKMDQALLVKQDIPIHTDYNDEVDESDYDHLACHADNIMRMAVDSTMLGSTFNSFSSSFSNSFMESGKDFLDKEATKSILEGLNF